MKKKLFSLVMFTFLVTGLLSACNSPSNIKGEFNQSSYVVSLDQTINFLDALTVSGIEKSEIVLSSSNEEILEDEGEGYFKAVKSGETYIFAKNDSKVVAKAKVNVKYKFSSPKNIKVSEDGIISWDKSFVVIDNQTSYANEYKITYAKYNADGSLGQTQEEVVLNNSFELGEKGSFKFTVQADEDEKKEIDASAIEEKILNNGVVGLIEGASLAVSENMGEQTARFSWTGKENTKYDIYLEGFMIIENTSDNFFDFDYSRFDSGKVLEVQIVAKDNLGAKLSTTSDFTLNKLATPNVDYTYENGNGYISWDCDENVSSYKMKVTDFDGNSKIYTIENANEINEYLSEYEGGAYNIQVMAVGQSEGGFFLNSDTTESKTFSKITTPTSDEIQVEFDGKTISVIFDGDAYSKNYRISYGEHSVIYNTALGLSTTINLAGFEIGEHSIEIVALPNADLSSDTGVEGIQYGDIVNARVINSNVYTFGFYILEEIGEITHSLSENISTISFDAVSNANTYLLYVNDTLIEDAVVQEQEGKVYIRFENLKQIEPAGDDYTFKVVAGRVVDGKEYSIEVDSTKTISILSVVTEADSQTNGFFAWNEVEGGEYYYEVYSTDENYENASAQPIISGTTGETITSPELGHGYYTIKVFTKTTDTNYYLDADFIDENAYFTQNFVVVEQVASPEISFSDENDIYKLTIKGVDFGGKYQIYVDGTLDGEIVVDQPKETYEYLLGATFEEVTSYEVSVVASCGLLYDENIYLPSDESKITIERLALTEFTMDYPRDSYKRKTNENMTFAEVDDSVAVQISLGGNVVLNEGYVLDLMDYTKFGSEFTLITKYIAKENEGTTYYLDSLPTEFKFKRATAPSMIVFDNGIVKWTGATDEEFDYYEGVVSLINSQTSNTYYSFELENTETEYDVQSLVHALSALSPAFASTYRQAEKVQVELYAFWDGEVDGVYRLPSANGTTTKGTNKLDILTLEKPVVMFDPTTRILSWTEQSEDSVYDIYVDGELAVEGHESNLITLAKLGEFDFLTEKTIQVHAKNSAYLYSELSDPIKIKEISISKNLAIAKVDNSFIATFNILADQANIQAIYLNGSTDNVNYTQGATVATFDLANFAGVTSFEIYLQAKNQSENSYYLDSQTALFELENLADKTLEIELFETNAINSTTPITDDNLRWEDYRDDFVGNSIQPIVYIVKVVSGEKTYDFVTNQCEFNLEEIESYIKNELSGEVKITVTASVSKDYVLTIGENGAFGYYGEVVSSQYTTSKLESAVIDGVNIIEESRSTSVLKQKMFAGIEVVFEDKWSSYDNLTFTFSWEGDNRIFAEASISAGEMKLESGYYHAFIKVQDYNGNSLEEGFLSEATQDITVIARRNNTINSTPASFTVSRLNAVSRASVSDDGVLTIVDSQTASYLLELKISDKLIYKTVLASQLEGTKEIDLMGEDFFGSITESGAYQISILAFDENEKILPSASAKVIEGNKLAGIQNISVDEKGYMIFSLLHNDYYNLIFTARMTNGEIIEKDFTANRVTGSRTDYEIAMRGIFELFEDEMDLVSGQYQFEFTVRDSGSINANWVPFSLNYQTGDNPIQVRGVDLEKDYLLFAIDEGTFETTSFTINVSGHFQSSASVEAGVKDYFYYPSQVKGFWVTDSEGNNGYVTENSGAVEGLVYTEYYIINLRSLLSSIAYGDVEVRIARVGKDASSEQTQYYQFNSTNYNLYKLNKVNDETNAEENLISIDNNILSWTWTAKDYSNKTPSAYYLIVEDIVYGNSTRILLSSSSIDLRTIDIEVEREYNLSVIAINFNTNILASNASQSLTTMRYYTPISLEVVDGQIVFNVEEFTESDFMQDIISFFAEATPAVSYYSTVGLKDYVDPFSFSPQTLATTKMQIKFTSVVEGGTTNSNYTLEVNAASLFPDIKIAFASDSYIDTENQGTKTDSYVNLLKKYKGTLENSDKIEAVNTHQMIETIEKSNFGIGDNLLLVDDLYRSLPEGEYMMSVSQIGASSFVESNYSSATKIYISAPSELTLDSEEIDGMTVYTATLVPTMNMVEIEEGVYQKQLAQKYKMQLRSPSKDAETGEETTILYDFIIQYSGSEWKISYKEQDLAGIITNVEWSGSIPKFKINMTALRHKLEEIGENNIIEDNKLININIFTYSQDDGYVVNGKSAKFAINYLALIPEDISFTNGEFIINSGLDSTYEVFIKYKHTSSTEQTITKNFQNGKVNISFDAKGVYEYVVFSINGSITSYRMNIASDSFEVRGIYKLSAPSLTTSNNNINISYLAEDIEYMNTLKFSMGNDISLNDNYNSSDKGYYYNSDISKTTASGSTIPYVVGSKDATGDTIYPSELMAEEFYAYLNGNTGTFAISEETSLRADTLLVFSEQHAVMSSAQSTIKAKMLPYLASIMLAGGDYYLDDRIIGINVATDENATDKSGNIVYEIIVDYYGADNTSNDNTAMKLHTETYYSERLYASEIQSIAQIVDSAFVNSNYQYFTISVSVLGALHSDSSNRLSKKTLEGTYVLLNSPVYYGPNTEYSEVDDYEEGEPMVHILRSQTITTPLMTRTAKPYLQDGSNGITNGSIYFVIDKSLYYTDDETESIEVNTAKRISIIAEYSDGNNTLQELVTGSIAFATSTDTGNENKVFVSVTPDEGLFASAKGTIKFSIKIYGNGAITSTPLEIENVYKLPKVEEKYYTIELVTDSNKVKTTYINFEKYFKSVSIAGDSMCYSIVVTYTKGGKEGVTTITANDDKRFALTSDMTKVTIQVQDNQSGTTTNIKKLIYSDTTELKLAKTDSTGLNVKWNEQTMSFEWSWTNGNTNSYEYYVEVSVGGIAESEVVTSNYYMPQNRGAIANGGFVIRARQISTDKLYIYSDAISYNAEVRFELFSGGNGSEINPYLIANETDFINISKRNTLDRQFYFKLTNDITVDTANMIVDGKPVISEFYGVLDGNGYRITIISTNVGTLGESYSASFTGMNSTEFTEYSSVFQTISSKAVVKNINIAYEIDYLTLASSNIIFSPISAYNYGTVNNVWVSSFTISKLTGSGQNNAFVGGIVGINYGTISNCSNMATMNYTMSQRLSLNFGYGGICLVNGYKADATGSITNCFNSGDKQITVTMNGNIVYLTGITLANAGKISTSGNDGAIRLSAGQGVNNFTGYCAGITISSSSKGTLEYLYNNGVIENTSVYGNLNFAGIVYTLSGGKINTLVETAGQAIVEYCTTKPTNLGTNYAVSGSGTHSDVATQVLSAQSIDCGNGYTLTIKAVDGGFIAAIG